MPSWDGQSRAPSPHMPSRCPHGATVLPCATVRCYCSAVTSHDLGTTPRVASTVNVPPHARSSHSGEGTARASLNHDKALDDDFQTQHTPLHRIMQLEDTSHRSSAKGRLECSGGNPRQRTGYHIDNGKEEETLETVDPTWQTTRWLQLAVQGISDEEVPWYKYVSLLMMGAEGMALSLAKHLLTIWQWNARVQGWDICPPAPTVLNIGQFMMWDEVQGDVDNLLWFEAYSCALQRVGEASWELPPSGVYRRRERGTILHAITFLDDLAVRVPTLDTWDQFIWPPSVAMPQAATEVEQYGYCHRNTMDLGTVMLVTEFRVTDEEGAYLCVTQGLIFEGSVLAYNAARDEAEWVPTCGVTNDLSWAEERTAVALANFVPRVPQEVDCVTERGACHVLGWANDSPSEEDDEQTQEEEDEQTQEEEDEQEGDECKEAEEWEEENPADLEEQGETGLEADPWRRSWEWGSMMDDEQPLAFDDLQSDSDTMIGGSCPACSTPQVPGSPQDAVEVHAQDSEVEAL